MMAPALDDGLMHDGNTGVTCPTCGGTAGAADSFCESCGTELAPPVSSAGPPGYTAQCPVCSLDDSAEPGPISAEGYCESCGRKVPSGRDHVELNLELLAGVTDRGLRHPRNEDAMALATTETPAGPVAIAVVCDGVSSSPNPEDASLTGAQAAVRMLLSSIRRGDDPDEASTAAVRQAHEAMAILGSPSRAPSATYVSVIVGRGGGHALLARRQPRLLAGHRVRVRPADQGRLAGRGAGGPGADDRGRGHGLAAGARDHPLARCRRGRAGAARDQVRTARPRGRAGLLRRAVELPARGGGAGPDRAPGRVPRSVQRRRRAAEVRPGRGRHGQHHHRAGPFPARAAGAVTKENPP